MLVTTLQIRQIAQEVTVFPENKVVHHIALFNLRPETTNDDVEKFIAVAEDLLPQIPGVLDVDLGRKARDEREVHFKDYDLALYVKLSQNSDLDVYAPHEKHQEFIQQASPKLELLQVIDFYGEWFSG